MMERVFVMLSLSLSACGGCEDSVGPSDVADDPSDMRSIGDRGNSSNSPSNEPSDPGFAGVPGECDSDQQCLTIYGGSGWPYAEPLNLTCATDPERGQGYCTECRTSSDCEEDYHCHDERFCWPNEKDHRGCISHEECKAEAEANPAQYGTWSPVRPIRCVPARESTNTCTDCDDNSTQTAECRQCVSDADCTPGGVCRNYERCYEPCETDEDCLEGWSCNDNSLCVRD